MTSDNGHDGAGPAAEELIAALVDAVAHRVIELREGRHVPERDPVEHWIDADQAAEHLSCNRRRIYDLVGQRVTSGIPVRREGSRLLFKRSELDQWIDTGGAA